ncbi:MAG: hypothetical protein JWO38_6695 [Gemmataceae bacterium]|nr:hypothetical protein [Gemmataceae bacterium]
MTRILLSLPVLLLLAPVAAAQDMPLSQILIDGEGWKKTDSPGPRPSAAGQPSTTSPDRSTIFTWSPGERFLHAAQTRPDGEPVARSPYAPLRLARGEKGATVPSLTTDKDGRIYAATPIGIQVFDPTGRLCGVVTAPAPGKMEHLGFEGEQLTAWVGETKYVRKVKTTGVK